MPTFRVHDGLELFYCVDDFTDPWTNPKAVLLHHGNGKNHRFWWGWIPVLARHYRVVRLDARGFGDSGVPTHGFPWSLSVFSADIVQLLDHLGLDKIHFVGETLGGTIGMNFAYEHPDRLRSLTVCTAPFKFPRHYYSEFAKMIEEKGIEAHSRYTMSRRLKKQSDAAHYEWYTAQLGRTKPWVVSDLLWHLAGKDLSDRLRQLRVPTLILPSPGQERVMRFREMHQLIQGSRLVRIKGATGFVQHSMPETCARITLDFLREVDSRPP